MGIVVIYEFLVAQITFVVLSWGYNVIIAFRLDGILYIYIVLHPNIFTFRLLRVLETPVVTMLCCF